MACWTEEAELTSHGRPDPLDLGRNLFCAGSVRVENRDARAGLTQPSGDAFANPLPSSGYNRYLSL